MARFCGASRERRQGFKDEWEQKPAELRQRLSLYTPERIIEAFISASVIRGIRPTVSYQTILPVPLPMVTGYSL
jgi:hypothetical protein